MSESDTSAKRSSARLAAAGKFKVRAAASLTTPINSEGPDFCGYYADKTPNEAAIDLSMGILEEGLVERYIAGRGGHDSKCCFHYMPTACNCRVADWRDAFLAAIEAIRASNVS